MSTINPDNLDNFIANPPDGSGDPNNPTNYDTAVERAYREPVKSEFEAAKADIEALEQTIGGNPPQAKGELWGHDGVTTRPVPAALEDNQVPVSDSSEQTGIKWNDVQIFSPTQEDGDLIVRSGTFDTNLPAGTKAGEALLSTGAASLPAYGPMPTDGLTDKAVTNPKLADMAANTIKLRPTTPGEPQDSKISDLAEQSSPGVDDWLLGEKSGADVVKIKIGNLPFSGAAEYLGRWTASGNYIHASSSLPTGYKWFLCRWSGMETTTSGALFGIQISRNGTLWTGASDYSSVYVGAAVVVPSTGNAIFSAQAANNINVGAIQSNIAYCPDHITIMGTWDDAALTGNPSTAGALRPFVLNFAYGRSNGQWTSYTTGGSLEVNDLGIQPNGIALFVGAGTFTRGYVDIWGIK